MLVCLGFEVEKDREHHFDLLAGYSSDKLNSLFLGIICSLNIEVSDELCVGPT